MVSKAVELTQAFKSSGVTKLEPLVYRFIDLSTALVDFTWTRAVLGNSPVPVIVLTGSIDNTAHQNMLTARP